MHSVAFFFLSQIFLFSFLRLIGEQPDLSKGTILRKGWQCPAISWRLAAMHTREPFLAWNHNPLGECLGTMNLALYQEGPQSSRLFDLNSDLLVNSYITDSW